jgi:transposase
MDETPIKAGTTGTGKMKAAYFWPIYGERDEI